MPETNFNDDITRMLVSIDQQSGSSEKLLPLVYEELRRLAAARMAREIAGQTLQPTALVHEVWIRLFDGNSQVWESRHHFYGAAAQAMRRILIERARKKMTLKHGSRAEHINLDDVDVAADMPDERILLIDEALERLEASDQELARIVTLKFYTGLTNDEVAEVIGVTKRTVQNKWNYAKAWLMDTIARETKDSD
jgi:RNA polymerase sigma factor (TIGR02999 family)